MILKSTLLGMLAWANISTPWSYHQNIQILLTKKTSWVQLSTMYNNWTLNICISFALCRLVQKFHTCNEDNRFIYHQHNSTTPLTLSMSSIVSSIKQNVKNNSVGQANGTWTVKERWFKVKQNISAYQWLHAEHRNQLAHEQIRHHFPRHLRHRSHLPMTLQAVQITIYKCNRI